MFYIIWIAAALIAVFMGLYTVGKFDQHDAKDRDAG